MARYQRDPEAQGEGVIFDRWEDPPALRTPADILRERVEKLCAMLRQRPGVWAMVYEGTHSGAGTIAGRIKRETAPDGGKHVATQRTMRDGRDDREPTFRVYARYELNEEAGE